MCSENILVHDDGNLFEQPVATVKNMLVQTKTKQNMEKIELAQTCAQASIRAWMSAVASASVCVHYVHILDVDIFTWFVFVLPVTRSLCVHICFILLFLSLVSCFLDALRHFFSGSRPMGREKEKKNCAALIYIINICIRESIWSATMINIFEDIDSTLSFDSQIARKKEE